MPQPNFNIEIHLPATQKDVAVLRLTGTLDSYTLSDLEKAVKKTLEEKRVHLIVNCQKLQFISSSGMGFFLGTLGEVEKQGGGLSFVQIVQPEVHDAMNLLGFFDVFSVYDKETEALEKIKNPS